MQIGQKIPVIDDFFRITFIENPGLAFGIDIDSNVKLWISLFSLFASIGLVIYLYFVRNENFGFRFSLALILGGAAGNMIDRTFYGVIYGYAPLFYGKVVDFLDFDFINLTFFGRSYDRFAIFNIADAAVTIGIVLLLFFHKSHSEEKEEVPIVPVNAANDTEINSDEPQIPSVENSQEKSEDLKLDSTTDKGKETPL